VPGGSRDNLEAANKITDWKKTPQPRRIILTDAQTSGGLLLCVKPSRLEKVRALVKQSAVIGKIVPRRKALLCINE
jgi:selenide,water dikinase